MTRCILPSPLLRQDLSCNMYHPISIIANNNGPVCQGDDPFFFFLISLLLTLCPLFTPSNIFQTQAQMTHLIQFNSFFFPFFLFRASHVTSLRRATLPASIPCLHTSIVYFTYSTNFEPSSSLAYVSPNQSHFRLIFSRLLLIIDGVRPTPHKSAHSCATRSKLIRSAYHPHQQRQKVHQRGATMIKAIIIMPHASRKSSSSNGTAASCLLNGISGNYHPRTRKKRGARDSRKRM
jgi:hypothetical protein